MNADEFITSLGKFIKTAQTSPDMKQKDTAEAMAEVCRALKVGKIELFIYENEASEHLGLYTYHCIYDSGLPCGKEKIEKRFVAIDENIVMYKVSRVDSAESWDTDEKEEIELLIFMISAYSSRNRLQKLSHHLTYFDSELDMYNLRQFMKNIRTLCKEERIDEYAAVYFNLKHFSVVNQQIGRENGTRVMRRYIGLFKDMLDGDELVCRIGGDNFILLLKQEKLDKALDILSGRGINVDENRPERIRISATAGVYVIPDMESFILPTDIMDRVSMAFHLAKSSIKRDVVFFDDALLAKSKLNANITASFPRAIEDHEFIVYYQPKISLNGLKVAGAEALCRWMHNGRLIPPADFIPVLEQGGDICTLDFYMLDTVCRDLRRWLDMGMNAVRVSVNLSRRHLADMDLLEHIVTIIDKYKVPHEYIEIELTETTTDVEFKDLKRTINGLQKTGISTSVDDFGIGYSSLNLIKEIPWNVLKLDKSLLPQKNDNEDIPKSIMFKYIVSMAQEMGLECIAEGVETAEHVSILTESSCDLAQGFYFDRPLPVEEFETRLRNYTYTL